jgi:hypothetical protein
MALPKIKSPIFELTLPSTGKAVKYRPFLVKEQKILLMALESQEQSEMIRAIKQIITNCAVDDIDVDDLPMFDLEYFFTRLRAKSIGEIIDLKFQHPGGKNAKGVECDGTHEFKLNLMDVEVQKDAEHTTRIVLDEETKIGVVLRYPTMAIADKLQGSESQSQIETIIELVTKSVECIFDEENVHPAEDSSPSEIAQFVNDLSQEQFAKLTKFFSTMPKLAHTVEWKCGKCGQKEKVELEGMASFFG